MNASGEAEAVSLTRLFALAKDLLSTFSSTFIFVDAIDEYITEERCLKARHDEFGGRHAPRLTLFVNICRVYLSAVIRK